MMPPTEARCELHRTPLLGSWVQKPSSDMHRGSWGGIMAGEPSCRSRARERRPSMYAVRRHPLITFFLLTYAISWVGLPLYAAGVWPIPFLATGPLIAALIVIPLTQGRAGLRELGSRMIRWQVGWIWWALAIGLPLGVHLVTAGLNVAAGVAVTFWYNWLFNRTGGSVLMTLVAHNIEGDIQAQGWIYMGVWLAVAIGLVVFDWQFWRGPAPAPATFQPAYGGESRVR